MHIHDKEIHISKGYVKPIWCSKDVYCCGVSATTTIYLVWNTRERLIIHILTKIYEIRQLAVSSIDYIPVGINT